MAKIKWINSFNTREYKSYCTFENYIALEDGTKCGIVEYRKWEGRYTAKRIVKDNSGCNPEREYKFFNTLTEAKKWVADWIKA